MVDSGAPVGSRGGDVQALRSVRDGMGSVGRLGFRLDRVDRGWTAELGLRRQWDGRNSCGRTNRRCSRALGNSSHRRRSGNSSRCGRGSIRRVTMLGAGDAFAFVHLAHGECGFGIGVGHCRNKQHELVGVRLRPQEARHWRSEFQLLDLSV